MNINKVEESLAKYHVLHMVIGLILGAGLFALPKIFGVIIAAVLLSIFMPAAVLPEFADRWLARGILLVGVSIAVLALHYAFHLPF
jgi:hypothetical protein